MDDDELIPLSYLAQYGYCPRRAALLLNEQAWEENEYTVLGRAEHERVHAARIEKRGPLLKLYEHTVYSYCLGLIGKCDCIEAAESEKGCRISDFDRLYQLYPIEYKHGTVRNEHEYQMQLCAQAMCLEEMYHTSIRESAIFYIDAHRRDVILLTEELRKEVTDTALTLHELAKNYYISQSNYSPKCKKCSMIDYCAPKIKRSARDYCIQIMNELYEAEH